MAYLRAWNGSQVSEVGEGYAGHDQRHATVRSHKRRSVADVPVGILNPHSAVDDGGGHPGLEEAADRVRVLREHLGLVSGRRAQNTK